MKKKLWLPLFALMCALFCLAGCASCTACDDGDGGREEPPQHAVHKYNRRNTDEKYLKSEASCISKAVYFYSCVCGEKGEETFEYGKLAAHIFVDYLSDENATCTRNCTETAKCENCTATDTRDIPHSKLAHSFGNYISNDDATCTKNCTETAECENCTATDTRDIADTKLAHSFVVYISDRNATCSKNCTETAECENCTATDTRDIPDSKLPHTFKIYYTNADATCAQNCTETARCEFCTATDTRDIPDSRLPHVFNTYISDENGTCSKNCTETARCEFCTATDTREIEDSKSHTYIDFICSICGAKYATQGLEYLINPDGISYSVSGKGTATDTGVYIPYEYNGLPVTAIDGISSPLFERVFIHEYVTVIGLQAFSGCSSLTEITVDEGNATYKSADGILYSKDGTRLIQYPEGKRNALFEVPDGVTEIGTFSLQNSRLLTEIIIPESVTNIGNRAFSGCASLKAITVAESNSNFKSIDGNLYSKDGSVLIRYPMGKRETSFAIPDSVTVIGEYAFYYCGSLERITVPDGVTEIGEGAFAYCSSLTSAAIPDGVTEISARTFYYCSSLTGVTMPGGITGIGDWAFYYCSSLTSITVPEGVTLIGGYAFCSCEKLESVTMSAGVKYIRPAAFIGCASLDTVYFTGTEDEWNNINISVSNTPLTGATVYFYDGTQPPAEGVSGFSGSNGEIKVG